MSLASVFSDKIPALEGLQESPALAEHLAAFQNLLKKLRKPYEEKPGRHVTSIIKEMINLDGGDQARLMDRTVQLSSFGMEISILRHIRVECIG